MAFHTCAYFFCSLLLLLLSGTSSLPVGINYGQIANNLLSPEKVVPILRSIGVRKVKLYDADPNVLRAFANTSVEFTVGLGNECLSRMRDQAKAVAWIKSFVQCHLPATKITSITVGNEILTSNDTSLVQNLLPAMQSMYCALQTLGLQKQITITSAHSLAILETSYPPSAGSFRKDLRAYISPILSFHEKTGSPFLINAYPFFAYKADPKQIPLDYVLFESKSTIVDPISKLRYENMLFAQIDAAYAAAEAVGHPRVTVRISETGWPSKGDEDEIGATAENARKYNGNLMNVVSNKKGTPMRPNGGLDVYVFALFNENLKPGPTSERNYGLLKPDGTPAYQLGLISANGSGSGSGGGGGSGGGDGGGALTPSPDGSMTNGTLNISDAAAVGFVQLVVLGVLCSCLSWFVLFL